MVLIASPFNEGNQKSDGINVGTYHMLVNKVIHVYFVKLQSISLNL